MKVGDIIQEKNPPNRRGLVVETGLTFRRAWRAPPFSEIMILLTNGSLLYGDPLQWEQIIEV